MALPQEKISELKQVIHNHLKELDIHGHIRNVLSESLRENEIDESTLGKANLLKILREKGIVDDVMKTLNLQDIPKENGKEHKEDDSEVNRDSWVFDEKRKFPIDPAKRYLYIQFLGGKAFLEYIQEKEFYPGHVTSTFTIHLNFLGQRYQSRPVACACEPAFEEGFLLELKKQSSENSRQPDASMLLSITDKIHFALIKTDPSGESYLMASHFIEWRKVLSSSDGRLRNAIEINGIGTEAKVPLGIVDVRLDLIPRLSQVIAMDVITSQQTIERNRKSERDRLFLTYSKQWWREYLQIRPSHSNRLVKIFAEDETSTHRFVCSYVQPLKAGRLLDTPRQAARFVSLLQHEKIPVMGGSRREMWTSLHSFVSRKNGEVEDHATLLCSLLLGYGMNAYVCIGTRAKGLVHAWVVTIGLDDTIIFWESLNGQRYKHERINPNNPPSCELPPKPQYNYRTVGCVFNNDSFYANTQVDDGVHLCSFELSNESYWKKMNKEAIKSVCDEQILPPARSSFYLMPSNMDSIMKSNDLENELRILVCNHRQDIGLITCWDEELSYYLSPALAAYEFECCNGVTIANDDFQHSIRRYIPNGQTFKGFPIQFCYINARRALSTCLRSTICEEVICCRGDQVKLALRCRIFTYPENTCAVWIMFAVRYKSIL